jgi:hypothetical protein
MRRLMPWGRLSNLVGQVVNLRPIAKSVPGLTHDSGKIPRILKIVSIVLSIAN